MAYYTGISGLQSFGGDGYPNPPQPDSYTQLGQTNYNIAQPLPVQQANNTAPPTGPNPLAGNTPSSQGQSSSSRNLQYANSIEDVPDSVQMASQRYLSGGSSYGDPSQSLFNRNLMGQYNQWTNQYGSPGEQFTPWALQTGANGGNYDPSQVDLFHSLAGKDPAYNFNSTNGQVMQTNNYYNPLSGSITGADPSSVYSGLSKDYKDISTDYIKNMFGTWNKLGVQDLPDASKYASQYYATLNPFGDSTPKMSGLSILGNEVGGTPEEAARWKAYADYYQRGQNSGLIAPNVPRKTYQDYVPPTTGTNIRTGMIR